MRYATTVSLVLLVGLASGGPHAAMAQSPAPPDTIADNDGIFIDGKAFSVTPGKAKMDASAVVRKFGARELGPGAIVFRSGRKLYIIDTPLRLPDDNLADPRNVFVKADAKPNRIRIEYVAPEGKEHQELYEQLKARSSLEMVQRLFSPFRLPVDVTIRTLGCKGQVNAWYDLEPSGPAVSICYEYVENIMRHAPMEHAPYGITKQDAVVGQFLFVIAHEMAHALFEVLEIPVFGREEDAADQAAAYMMLHLGKDRALALVGGAAYAYYEFIKGYKENPKVMLPLVAFSSSHGSPEERFYNLLCLVYGSDPKMFPELIESELLPKTRARNCAYEFKTLRHAVRREIAPHIDWSLAKGAWSAEALDEWFKPEPSRSVAKAE